MTRGAQVVEEHTGQNGAEFSRGGADAVGETADTGWVQFSGDDEGGGVGTKVEEHLKARDQYCDATLFGRIQDTRLPERL